MQYNFHPFEQENRLARASNDELCRRLTNSEKLLSRVNDELAQYRKNDGMDPSNRTSEDQRLRNKWQASVQLLQIIYKLEISSKLYEIWFPMQLG